MNLGLALIAVFRSDGQLSRRAWEARDATLLEPLLPDSTSVRKPDGSPIIKQEVLADGQRRMNMTSSIDTMTVAGQVTLDSRR